jgi:exosortase/archaeosortase family protein
MWPLLFLEEQLSFRLRLLSHHGVATVLSWLHAPVVAEGTTFLSATPGQKTGSWMTLQVEGKCSGMNTLFALMFAALLYSYHAQQTFWRRALLFSFSIPLAILGNMLRIGILIAGCAVLGQETAVGDEQMEMSPFHLLAGLAVFVVAYLGLQWISALMDRWNGIEPTKKTRRRQVGKLARDTA